MVAVQPPNALQQQIHGAKLCDKNVQINVQRLLHHLRAHHDQVIPFLRRGFLADACHQLVFPRRAVRHQKLRMEQLHLFVRQAFPQQLRDLLRFLTVFTITPAQPPSASFRRSSAGSSGSVSVVSCTV